MASSFIKKIQKKHWQKDLSRPTTPFRVDKRHARFSDTWFRKKLSKVAITPREILANSAKTKGIRFGKMYFYIYDPKTKADLPYYDKFPLVIPIEPYENGFLGLNMHYLNLQLRNVLIEMLRKDKMSDLLITYNMIKDNPLAAPCIKRYLYSHVRSAFVEIQPNEFDWVLYLPVERFEKKSKYHVWAMSSKGMK